MDVVITYVDITERFKDQYFKYVKKELEENRFRSYGVLDLQIKGIRKYMPYIKNIFVVVSEKEQVEGIDLSDAIIIEHKDIIPERYLPCFNSCSIEMFLWKIPGLAEEFIYFNDDIFVIDKIHPSKWFIKGKPVLFPKEHEIKEEENIFKRNCINSSKLAIDITGSDIKDKYFTQTHCARPFLKSSCEKVFNLKVLDIIHSLTRTRHSKNYNASLFNDYDYLSSKAYKMEVKYTYINTYEKSDKIVDIINNKNTALICINDNDEYIDLDNFYNLIRNILISNINDQQYKIPKILPLKNSIIKNNLLSIIVPIYNAEQYLDKCIQSIIDNDYFNFELLLIDDGSKDNSLNICNKYKAIDKRIVVIHKENSGVSDTRNIGIDICKGKYISFVDSDDWIEPERFTLPIKNMIDNNILICQCGFKIYKNDENTSNWIWKGGIYNIKDNILLSSAKYDIGHSCSKVYNSKLIKDNNIKFPKCDFCEDLIFNVKCYCFAEQIEIIQYPLYCYRRDVDNSLSTTKLTNERKLNLIKSIDNVILELDNNDNFKLIKTNFTKFIQNALKNRENNNSDLVISYINSKDRTWAAIYSDFEWKFGKKYIHIPSKYFKYLFRSIEKYKENIGIIHFIVMKESMVPQWINKNNIHIVTHDMIYDKSIQPIFSNDILNYNLKNIIGLSKKYEIITNDNLIYNCDNNLIDINQIENIDKFLSENFSNKSKYERIIDVNNFIGIGGNCVTLGILGQERIRGPIDNFGCINGLKSFKTIIDNTFLLEIYNKYEYTTKNNKQFETDPDLRYYFKNFRVSHNIPNTEKFNKEITKRYNNLINFDIKNPNNYYTYGLCDYDINIKTHKPTQIFYDGIEYIKSIGLLDKIIFVETKNLYEKSYFNFWSTEIEEYFEKNNIKYIKIYDFNIWYVEETVHKFLNEIDKLNL